MQVFVPYPSPIEVAKCMDRHRLHKQIIECHQILAALDDCSFAWKNHPVTKMYSAAYSWLHDYMLCLEYYITGNEDMAEYWSSFADGCRPPFLTDDFCDQHKRRLYTKDPVYYQQFAKYGTSEENWYVVNGKLLKYINGKQV